MKFESISAEISKPQRTAAEATGNVAGNEGSDPAKSFHDLMQGLFGQGTAQAILSGIGAFEALPEPGKLEYTEEVEVETDEQELLDDENVEATVSQAEEEEEAAQSSDQDDDEVGPDESTTQANSQSTSMLGMFEGQEIPLDRVVKGEELESGAYQYMTDMSQGNQDDLQQRATQQGRNVTLDQRAFAENADKGDSKQSGESQNGLLNLIQSNLAEQGGEQLNLSRSARHAAQGATPFEVSQLAGINQSLNSAHAQHGSTEGLVSKVGSITGAENSAKHGELGKNGRQMEFGTANAKEGEQAKQMNQQTQVKVIERIRNIMEQAVKTRDSNTLVFRLDPPNLGNMTVKLVHRSDELFARVTPENAEVEAVLRANHAELTQILTSSGLKAENIHVTIGAERGDADWFRFNEFLSRHDGGEPHHGFEEGSNRTADERGADDDTASSIVRRQYSDQPTWIA